MTEQTTPTPEQRQRIEIETREVAVDRVNYPQRIVTVVAAPYEQPATVLFKGEPWQEIIERGAWDGVISAPHRVRANRDHNRARTVGKVVKFYPERDEGLVADIKIAKTPLGEETLELATDDCLSASVGFGVMPGGHHLDMATRTRRVKTAYLDHIAFVEAPAYENANVLAVRGEYSTELLESLLTAVRQHEQRETPLGTPFLDELSADPTLRWVAERLHK